jgi:protein TonB
MLKPHILFLEEVDSPPGMKRSVILPPPKVDSLQDVFAEAIIEHTSMYQRRSPLDWAISLAVHTAVLAVLLILPLYFTNVLDVQKLNLTILVAPLPPAAPPPPMAAHVAPRVVHTPTRTFTPGKLTAPSFIPKAIATLPEDESAPGVPGGVAGGIPGGQIGGVLGGILGGTLNRVPTIAQPVAAGPKVPVRVGGDVKAPRLLYGPAPDYPILAKQSHLSGVVAIEAVIDEHGNVTGMRVISGHPILIPAALKAVSQRKYEPTILDGEPTPINLRIEVSFNFS